MPSPKRTTERWTSISAWVAASALGWIGCVYARLNQLQSVSNVGRLVGFAELRPLQSGGGKCGWIDDC
ncbi:unnamed protein product [Prunus armeniaca]